MLNLEDAEVQNLLYILYNASGPGITQTVTMPLTLKIQSQMRSGNEQGNSSSGDLGPRANRAVERMERGRANARVDRDVLDGD
jgi:hypothetical protein